MIHALITLVFCATCLFLGLPWPLFFWLAAFYLGREVAQSEYRYIEAHGGKRENCPWWCGLVPSAWTLKSLLDCLLPLAVSAGFTLASLFLR